MGVSEQVERIVEELSQGVSRISDDEVAGLIKQIKKANHIFIAGAGRSGMVIKGFANRLLHLGFSVSIVGEISSPHSKLGDLLIIGSGSGETGSLKSLAEKARNNGVNIALVTLNEASSIGKLSNSTVVLAGSSKADNAHTSIQPMGSAFEQLCFLLYDGIVLQLMDELGETNDTMFVRHADLE